MPNLCDDLDALTDDAAGGAPFLRPFQRAVPTPADRSESVERRTAGAHAA